MSILKSHKIESRRHIENLQTFGPDYVVHAGYVVRENSNKSIPDYAVQAMSMMESSNIESRLCRIENIQFFSPDYVVQAMSNVKTHIESRLCSPG
jgi:hypothetical protein